MKQNQIGSMVRVAVMAGLIAVCSWITIPLPVPVTMQTFAVFFALAVLGGKKGTIAVGVYLLLGAIGLPVFSGFGSGIGVLLGPTGGYLLGFLCMGLFEWLLEKNTIIKQMWLRFSLGLVLCYLFGTIWFSVVYATRGTPMAFGNILLVCVVPFLIPDGIKLGLACALGKRVSKIK